MHSDESQSGPIDFVRQAERYFAALVRHGGASTGLGGKLLYAGVLDPSVRALIAAANVAGAASFAAAPDAAPQKQAVRDGIADFLVTSLDEALRILKNEVRKQTTVAVCISLGTADLEAEMHERGVVPDLVPRNASTAFTRAQRIDALPVHAPMVRLEWQVAAAPALWMPKLDEIARACLTADDVTAQRWLRLAPRYGGRTAAGLRVLRCSTAVAEEFAARVSAAVAAGSIGVPVEVTTRVD